MNKALRQWQVVVCLLIGVVAPNHADSGKTSTGDILVYVDASELPYGTLTRWTNKGTEAGHFALKMTGLEPKVEEVSGRKAVTFTEGQWLESTFTAPDGITGNSDYTVAVWAHNPTIDAEECMLTWSGRGGASGTGAQMNFGNAPEFGAVSHWWYPHGDMGFDGGVPSAGKWHHIAVTFDGRIEKIYVDGCLNAQEAKILSIYPQKPIRIGCADYSLFFSGSLAGVCIYDYALDEEEIGSLVKDTGKRPAKALVYLNTADLKEGPLKEWRNKGSLGGQFRVVLPEVVDVDGRKAVTLLRQTFKSSFITPAGITGNGDYTMSVRAYNPNLSWEECMVAWSKRGGPDGTNAQFNFGKSPEYGAVSHWSRGDTGFDGYFPTPGHWHHIVVSFDGNVECVYVDGCLSARRNVTLNTHSGQPIHIGSADGEFYFSGALSEVRIYDRALAAEEITALHAQGVCPNLQKWKRSLEGAKTLLEKGQSQKAITSIEKAIVTCERWTQKQRRQVNSNHIRQLREFYRLLANLKLAAGASSQEITDIYVRSGLLSIDAPDYASSFLWLYSRVSAQECLDAARRSMRDVTNHLDRIEVIVSDFQASNNWAAFELFLDALFYRPDKPSSMGEGIMSFLRWNHSWLKKYYGYCQKKAELTHVVWELSNVLAFESFQQNKFGEACDFYLDAMGRSNFEDEKINHELKMCECLFRDAQCEKAITALDAFLERHQITAEASHVGQAMLLKAHSLIRLGRIDKASDVLAALVNKVSGGELAPEALLLLGYCNMAQGEFTKAEASFGAVIREDPASSYASKARLCQKKVAAKTKHGFEEDVVKATDLNTGQRRR